MIYPICPIKTDDAVYGESTDPIKITSSGEAYDIYTIYTTAPAADASFRQVENAYNYLTRESSADNKLLLILTSSVFSDLTSADELGSRLNQMTESQSVKVCYFATSEALYVAADGAKGLHTYYKDGIVNAQALLDFTLRFCAEPFQRTKLLTSSNSLTRVHIKEPCNLVVFANGASEDFKLKSITLTDNDGNTAQQLMQGSWNNYSKIKAEGFEDAPVDTSLQGYVSIYYDCKPGQYYINLHGADWVDIYTQPSNNGSWVDSYMQKEEYKAPLLPYIVLAIVVILAIAGGCIYLCRKTKRKKYEIFISYRRDGGNDLAGRLEDRLKHRGYRVFFDIESMRSGEFNEQIYYAIDECTDVLLVLPPFALDRCVNEDDWVRKEIVYAIEKGKNIIPIMMRGFEFPKVLPKEIDKIRLMNGIEASPQYFDAVIDKIVQNLKCKKK